MADEEQATTPEELVDAPDVKHREDPERYLPAIKRIKLPHTTTQTALVRWLFALGYPVKEIHNGLNIRYQQVRNMVTTIPKRAAREDLPPLEITLQDPEDVVDMLLGDELERTHLEARKQTQREVRKQRREAAALEPAGAELDDENYGR